MGFSPGSYATAERLYFFFCLAAILRRVSRRDHCNVALRLISGQLRQVVLPRKHPRRVRRAYKIALCCLEHTSLGISSRVSGQCHASLGHLVLSYLPEVSRYPDYLAAQDSSRQSRSALSGGDEARFPMKNR